MKIIEYLKSKFDYWDDRFLIYDCHDCPNMTEYGCEKHYPINEFIYGLFPLCKAKIETLREMETEKIKNKTEFELSDFKCPLCGSNFSEDAEYKRIDSFCFCDTSFGRSHGEAPITIECPECNKTFVHWYMDGIHHYDLIENNKIKAPIMMKCIGMQE